MIYVISIDTFGEHEVHDIQCNSCWSGCAIDGYALIPDGLVEGILETSGYCDIVLNNDGTEVSSFTARPEPFVERKCTATPVVMSVNGVTADASGNVQLPQTGGASSWNDLTDKPFYEESVSEALLEEAEYAFSANADFGCYANLMYSQPFVLTEGKEYTVVWDNEEYVRTAFAFTRGDASCVAVGNPVASGAAPNDDKFAIVCDITYGFTYFFSLETLDSHKVGVYHDSVVVKTLDEKFLPMAVIDARIEEYISAALEGDY